MNINDFSCFLCFSSSQYGPKLSQVCRSWRQVGSSRLQVDPKLVQVGPKTAQKGPRCGHAGQIVSSLMHYHWRSGAKSPGGIRQVDSCRSGEGHRRCSRSRTKSKYKRLRSIAAVGVRLVFPYFVCVDPRTSHVLEVWPLKRQAMSQGLRPVTQK